MQCAICGYQNNNLAKICASCGAPLNPSVNSAPISNTPGISTGHTSGNGANGVYTPHLAKGIRLQNGNYAVGEVLGQGGFGITYKGGDLTLRRYVAIKEFFPQGCARQGNTVAPAGTLSAADYAGVKAKFIEEARTLARFNDPGIVRVFGVFEENNTAYMVMEFLEGQTLSHLITGATAQNKTLDETLVIEIANKVGHALSVVHHAGLIHRDIKPDNICQTKDGRIVLIDFGTARSFASGKTVQQTTMLTPGYAPLEQYGQQARFGAYTDLYALAATLYHCLTGQVPPQATDRAAGVELKAPNLLNPRVSTAVSNALVWAMQVKATDRPQTVAQFLDALKNANPLKPAPQQPTVQPQDSGTVLIPPGSSSPNNAWGTPSVPSSPPMPVTNTGQAFVQQIADNQLLTNAEPQDVLRAVHLAFLAFGITNPTVDTAGYRVNGSTGIDLRSWAQNVVGQVTQDARGIVVTVSSTAAVGITDYGRGRDETRRLMAAIQTKLQGLLAAPNPGYSPVTPAYPPQPVQPSYAPPIAQPYGGGYAPPAQPYGGGYAPPAQPYIKMQGSSVLTLSLLGFFCCGICSVFAWVNGNSALQEYGDRDPGDRGTVVAGRILGIIGTVLWGLYLSGIFISALGS